MHSKKVSYVERAVNQSQSINKY